MADHRTGASMEARYKPLKVCKTAKTKPYYTVYIGSFAFFLYGKSDTWWIHSRVIKNPGIINTAHSMGAAFEWLQKVCIYANVQSGHNKENWQVVVEAMRKAGFRRGYEKNQLEYNDYESVAS
jgi:hypothetical protein